MKISVVGVGYAGLAAADCLAESGNHIICVKHGSGRDLSEGKFCGL